MADPAVSQEMEVQRHGIMYLLSTLGITIAGFFATMFYAHWVGAEILGSYFLFLSYFGILSLFSDSGIEYAAVKRISEGKDPDAFFTAGILLRIAVYSLTIAVFILFRDRFVDLNQAGLFWVLIAVLGLGSICSHIRSSIVGSNRLGLAASTLLLNNLVRIGAQVLLVFLGYRLLGLVGGVVAGFLCQLAIESRFIDQHVRRFGWEHVRDLLTYSVWAFLTSSGNTFFEYMDVLVIGYYLAVSDAGVYGICWTFSFSAIFLTMALSNTLFVKVSRWNSLGDSKAVTTSLTRACTYSLVFAIPILAGGILLGGPLLYYLYGASFSTGTLALILLIGMRVFQSVQQLCITYLMALNHNQEAFVVTGTMAAMKFVLDLVLVPAMGIPGAAVASLVTMGVGTGHAYLHLRKYIPVAFDAGVMKKAGVAAFAMVAVLLLLLQVTPMSAAVQPVSLVGVGAAVYFGLLLAMDAGIRASFRRIFEIDWNP
jgi:O-antigen/teichoic acid export membrane protein